MVMKYIRKNYPYGIVKGGTRHRQKKSRNRDFPQLSRGKTSFPSWPAAFVGSTLALGLVTATTVVWADTPALAVKKPSLSVSAPTYLTEVLPPYLPTYLRNLVQDKYFLSRREVLFIDQGVSGYQGLLDSMARNIEVVFLAPDQDGVTAIAEHLQGRTDLRGIHIVSHGGPGRLYLGNMTLTANDLDQRQKDLAIWSKALGPQGDVLLYGCDVARGLEGIRFVNRLSHILTAGISASDDPTGSPALGGDWAFEYSRNVETDTIFTGSVSRHFHALLAPGQVIAGDGSGGGGGGGAGGFYNIVYPNRGKYGGKGGGGGGDNDTLTGTAGNDVIFGDGSGGGGGGGGAGTIYSWGGFGGFPGPGGSGSDVINGGGGDDIIFGDGHNGFFGENGSYGEGGSGGNGGFGNINAGTGGIGGPPVDYSAIDKYSSTLPATGTDGSAGFGGALGGLGGGTDVDFNDLYSLYYSFNGQPGEDGSIEPVIQADTGGEVHAAALANIRSGYFDNKKGGNGNDEINGGPGSDILFGMGGTNTFVFEADDAISGRDIDTIYGWNDGFANMIDLRVGGNTFDSAQVAAVVVSQKDTGSGDRTIVLQNACNKVSIVFKDIDRNLTGADFFIGTGAVFSPPKNCFPWNMFMPAIIGGQKP